MRSWKFDELPRHVAIIMDGNGRWANQRGLARSFGHSAGVRTLKNILLTAVDIKLEALTVYAFSTENWRRPPLEIEFLLKLFADYLTRETLELHQRNVRIKFLGRTHDFPSSLQKLMRDAVELTRNNSGLKFNVAADYGGQDEIVRAAQFLARRVENGEISSTQISAELFNNALDTAELPQVDFMIRTGGEFRLSNFLLWQAAYAEFYFTDTPWPELTPDDFLAAIRDFGNRSRRFGALHD